MPTTVPVDSTGLALGYCPDPLTWQQLAIDINATQTVEVPDVAGFAAQATPPATSLIWVETSASAPYVLSIRAYAGADWRRIPAPPTQIYFEDSGAANVVTISTGETITSELFLAGRIFVIKLNNSPTGATTLTVDGLAAKNLYKTGSTAIESGDFVAGQLILVGYDDVSDHFEILTSFGDETSPYAAAVVKYSGAAGTNPQTITANTETTVSLNTEVDPDGFVTLNSNQITLLTGKYLIDFTTPLFRSAANSASVIVNLRDVTGSNATLASGVGWVPGGDGAAGFIRVAHAVTITAASNVYDFRVYAEAEDVDLGIEANAGSYTETYQICTITKIA